MECVEKVRRFPLTTSTRGRCGAGGGIAADVAVGFPTKADGGCMAAGAAGVKPTGNEAVEPI